MNLVNCLKTFHLIILSHLLPPTPVGTLTWSTVENLSSDHPIPNSSLYVNLVNCLKTSYLIVLFHPLLSPECTLTWLIVIPLIDLIILFHSLHPFPGCMWTLSTVIPGVISSHSRHLSQEVREHWDGRLFEYLSSDQVSLPLHSSPESMSTWSIVRKSPIWSSLCDPPLLTYLQLVREPGQLFGYMSPNHPIPSTSSTSRKYVNLVNCLKTSHMIILSHHIHSSPESMWICSTVWIPLIWLSPPILIALL